MEIWHASSIHSGKLAELLVSFCRNRTLDRTGACLPRTNAREKGEGIQSRGNYSCGRDYNISVTEFCEGSFPFV
jgi:hypothetical protein